MNLETAKEAAKWMRETGVLRLTLKSGNDELQLEVLPSVEALSDSAPTHPEDTAPPLADELIDGNKPRGPKCGIRGCPEKPNGIVPGYCRIHGLQEAGVATSAG